MATTDLYPTDHTDQSKCRSATLREIPSLDLTEQIIGCMFQVYNVLKFGHPEKYYQRALAEQFHDCGLRARREVYFPVRYGQKIVGRYFFDFVVDDQVVVELKIAPQVFGKHLQQVLAYLRATKLRLALICLIQKEGVLIKRVIV